MRTSKSIWKIMLMCIISSVALVIIPVVGNPVKTNDLPIRIASTGRSLAGIDSPDVSRMEYPASEPLVIEREDMITILFPDLVGVRLERNEEGGIYGIKSLFVGQRKILSSSHDIQVPPVTLIAFTDDAVGGVTDWPGYLLDREASGGEWPQTGNRGMYQIGLDSAQYIGYYLDGETVVLVLDVQDGEWTGELEWVFTAASAGVSEHDYLGIGWKMRLAGVDRAAWLRIVEPAVARSGDWAIAQTWEHFIESQTGHSQPFHVQASWYFGDVQPFFFTGGSTGVVLSFFEEPVCARVEVNEVGKRHLVDTRIPLGEGAVRETPTKYWMSSDTVLESKWEAVDEWTMVFDFLEAYYRELLGLGFTELVPVLEMRFADEEYMARYIEEGPPPLEESWLYTFAHNGLQEAADLGFRLIRVVAWESDAEHSPEEYLEGSQCFGSANAPWQLEISEALGGVEALRELTDRAHDLGVKIVLWNSPGHLSNSSPLLVENPEWIMWRRNGTPEDVGYGDVVGMSLHTDYYTYAMSRYENVRQSTNVDGFMVDSHLTFGLYSDFRLAQPSPQLDLTLETQHDWWNMGFTDIIIEGCGPLGLSSGGYPGYESFIPPAPPEEQEEARRRLKWILGREYGIYRFIVDTVALPGSYYRALASKGHVSPQYLDVLNIYSEENIARIQQANFDFLQVKDLMERRTLVAEGDEWLGVAWSNSVSSDLVLFSFDHFFYLLDGYAEVEDVTTGAIFPADGGFETEPWHTYHIVGGNMEN